MLLKGSCHCGAVKFKLRSHTPYPYNRCYCAICRKTAGGGGYAINIMGEADTLVVEGKRHLTVYRARLKRGKGTVASPSRRHFCMRCGSALWVWDADWPEWVYPFASAIDTRLPVPPRRTHHHAGLDGAVGGCARQARRQAVPTLPRRGHRRLAQSVGPGGEVSRPVAAVTAFAFSDALTGSYESRQRLLRI